MKNLSRPVLLVVSSQFSDAGERYIQRTRVPMLHFQPSLPRLPIPKFTDTCARYLESLGPVSSADQFSRTQSIVSEFLKEGGEGEGSIVSIVSLCVLFSCATQHWINTCERLTQETSTPATSLSPGTTCTSHPGILWSSTTTHSWHGNLTPTPATRFRPFTPQQLARSLNN